MLVAEHLIGKGLSLLVYDPEVHLSSLLGANRRFVEQHVPHLGALMRPELETIVAGSEVLVVGLSDRATVEGLKRHARPDHVILDLVGIPDRSGLPGEYVGLSW